MLSPARVIGHREYAGGRKSDPRHDMNWRRNRVAGFVPRNRKTPPIVGRIGDAYHRGAWAAYLGAPKGPEVPTLDGLGRWQEFEKGAVYWHPKVDGGVAHVVFGGILAKFWSVGAEVGIGYPTTDEQVTPDRRGRYSHFAGVDGWPASIYAGPGTGIFLVKGAIRARWAELGWENGLGYPTSDEIVISGGRGRFQRFAGRPGIPGETGIYWTAETGAQPIMGAFRDAWAASGWENGPWGYPTSGEHVLGGVLVQDFVGGRVSFVGGRPVFESAR